MIGVLFSAKILVVGGFEGFTDDRSRLISPPIEIFDLINTKLKSDIVVDANGSRIGATGCVLQNLPLFCGGAGPEPYVTTNVSIIGMPNHGVEMMIPRRDMSTIVLSESKIWVTGGTHDNGNYLNTTEIISLDQPSIPGPDLPFTYGLSLISSIFRSQKF